MYSGYNLPFNVYVWAPNALTQYPNMAFHLKGGSANYFCHIVFYCYNRLKTDMEYPTIYPGNYNTFHCYVHSVFFNGGRRRPGYTI